MYHFSFPAGGNGAHVNVYATSLWYLLGSGVTLRVKAAEATAATHAGIRNQRDAATGNSEQGLTVWVTSLQREPEALLRSLQEF